MLIKIVIIGATRKQYYKHDFGNGYFVLVVRGDMREYDGSYDTLAEAERYTQGTWWGDDVVLLPNESDE